jgi:CHAD domain-containing protein
LVTAHEVQNISQGAPGICWKPAHEGSITVNLELQNVKKLASALREKLARCACDPDVDSVHDTRTGTRRLQATIENLVRELPEGKAAEAVRDAAQALMRQLKRIRRAAGTVRDLDVHRKLLEHLAEAACGEQRPGAKAVVEEAATTDQPDILEAPEAGLRISGFHQRADDLDAWLEHQRKAHAEQLRVQAPDLVAKFDKRLAGLVEALGTQRRRRRIRPAAAMALDSFAMLATEMQLLDASNLHDFRKGAKKARYVAELAAQTDAYAGAVGKSLKKLQDEIGDWHDWLVLADEAHAALGDQGGELIGMIEAKREEHFIAAMKSAAKLRGRLMGVWLAGQQRRRRRATPTPRSPNRRLLPQKSAEPK